jgi:hypothetical protein
MSSEPDLSTIYRANLGLYNEILARDAVFRRHLDEEKRRAVAPWVMAGRVELASDEQDVWRKLGRGELTPHEALDALTDLMEQYYGAPYSLRQR